MIGIGSACEGTGHFYKLPTAFLLRLATTWVGISVSVQGNVSLTIPARRRIGVQRLLLGAGESVMHHTINVSLVQVHLVASMPTGAGSHRSIQHTQCPIVIIPDIAANVKSNTLLLQVPSNLFHSYESCAEHTDTPGSMSLPRGPPCTGVTQSCAPTIQAIPTAI